MIYIICIRHSIIEVKLDYILNDAIFPKKKKNVL